MHGYVAVLGLAAHRWQRYAGYCGEHRFGIANKTVMWFRSAVWKVSNTEWIMLWGRFIGFVSLCRPPTAENHPTSRGLIKKISTVQEIFG